jgi:uncharacterized protein (TIGR02246 family)
MHCNTAVAGEPAKAHRETLPAQDGSYGTMLTTNAGAPPILHCPTDENRLMSNSSLPILGLEKLPLPDREAVGRTVSALLTGFATRNAAALEGVYSTDADWVNAFGTVKKGSGEIVPYLKGLFADTNFDAGELVAPPHSALRVLGNDVVAVSTHLQIKGQRLLGGGTIALRDNYSLRILQKQADGTWLIVSEMYMDARQDQTYAAHS